MDDAGQSWFTADQLSTQFGSFDIPEVTSVGLELDRKLAALLETLNVEVPMMLLSEHAIFPDSRQ